MGLGIDGRFEFVQVEAVNNDPFAADVMP